MKFALVLLFSFVSVSVFSQQPLASKKTLSPDQALQKFRDDYPQEKTFLFTDKDQYFAGETIWMKAWCTTDGLPSFLSRILYIDLVGSDGKVVFKKMYKLDTLASTTADFDLPQEIKSGNYAINAYTLWMLNFPEFVYRKSIFIYNSDFLKTPRATSIPSINLRFFPEGGNLIEGVGNRIAFVITDDKGMPVNTNGFISDNTGKKIADITVQHNGMGHFELEPEAGKVYQANIPAANGTTLQFKMPEAAKEGVSLRVENGNPNRMSVLLNRAEQNKEKYNKVRVVAQMHYQILADATLNFDEGATAMPISKKNLPAGIMQVTVFDEAGMPLAERIVFVENYSIVKPRLSLDTLNTAARKKNVYSFALDSIGLASVAVSVTNASFENTVNQSDNIASSLFLTSDIRGVVHQPGYYVKDKSAVTLRHADLLMMTQGWRRFEWKKITGDEYAAIRYPVESSITLRGSVRKSDRNALVKDGHVAFIIKAEDSTTILADARLTDKGEFMINDLAFKKQASISYQGTNNKSAGYIVDVTLEPSYIDSLKRSSNSPRIDLDTMNIAARQDAMSKYLFGKIRLMDTLAYDGDLGNVTVSAKRRKIRPEDSLSKEYATGVFEMGKSVDPGQIGFATSIWQVIQREVPGIDVSGSPISPVVRFTRFQGLDALSENNSASFISASGSGEDDYGTMLNERNGVAYFLNEVNVSMDVINSINVADVALIKVLKTEAAALGASGGAIAIYTKKGVVPRNAVYDKTFATVKRDGYALVKTFFSPDYSNEKQAAGPADGRHTLYWNSFVKPSKDGKYKIRFFNNDISKKFKINIQGISKDGKLIFMEDILQ